MKNVSAILSADWHIRETAPVCRDESEYFAAQAKKIEFIKGLRDRIGCPILVAGDIFNHWKPSPFLLGWCMEQFPSLMWCVPGQHDLPQHNKLLYQKSGLHVLGEAERGTHVFYERLVTRIRKGCGYNVTGFWYGEELGPHDGQHKNETHVALAHTFTWRGRKPWPDCVAPGASTLLNKMQGFDLIVTGDNHKAFTLEQDGRLLVNPGSIMRMSADQADFKPRVYLWDAEANCVEPVFLPIEKGVVSRDHLDRAQERDERIESFVARLQGQWKAGLSFEENLTRFFETNEVPEVIKQLIYEAMEG